MALNDSSFRQGALADAVLSFQIPDDAIQRRVREIHHWLLRHSQYIRTANYTRISSPGSRMAVCVL